MLNGDAINFEALLKYPSALAEDVVRFLTHVDNTMAFKESEQIISVILGSRFEIESQQLNNFMVTVMSKDVYDVSRAIVVISLVKPCTLTVLMGSENKAVLTFEVTPQSPF